MLTVARADLEAVLDELPAETAGAAQRILDGARYDRIVLEQRLAGPYPLTGFDMRQIKRALGRVEISYVGDDDD